METLFPQGPVEAQAALARTPGDSDFQINIEGLGEGGVHPKQNGMNICVHSGQAGKDEGGTQGQCSSFLLL